MNDIEVEDAVSRGLVPKVSMVTARHKSHEHEERVQEYLRRHGIRAGITYQSMFVGWNSGTAVKEEVARKFGTPLVVQPALVTELVVACLGDLQNAVGSIAKGEHAGSELEGRIINLEAVEDRTAALRVLSDGRRPQQEASCESRLPGGSNLPPLDPTMILFVLACLGTSDAGRRTGGDPAE